jgi:Xaa-Pro aminopeptidase
MLNTYAKRRKNLQKPDTAFLLPGASVYFRNEDVAYPFRQESNFYYLTGIDQADCFLLILPEKSILFLTPADPIKTLWEGESLSFDQAQEITQVEEVKDIKDLDSEIEKHLKNIKTAYYRLSHRNDRILNLLAQKKIPLFDPCLPLSLMRLKKDPQEIALLRKACDASAKAHNLTLRYVQPNMTERQVQSYLEFVFSQEGCQRQGYGSIVAAGKNATTLHYQQKNARLQEQDLLLIDAAGEFDYYTADITRTFPIGKSFSAEQKKIYSLVLQAQKEAILLAQPGATLTALHQRTCEVLTEGLLSLSLLPANTTKKALQELAFRPFFPHKTSHWLGLDVHDLGPYFTEDNQPVTLEPGMVFTVEPGLYFNPQSTQGIPEAYHHIGVRIEDNILITATGHEDLTQNAMKEIDAILAEKNSL